MVTISLQLDESVIMDSVWNYFILVGEDGFLCITV